MTIYDFLIYLGGIGVVAVVSWLFEDWVWFQELKGKVKQIVFFAFCAVIALGAQAVVTFVDPLILAAIAPWFATVAALFAYVFLGNQFHQKTKLTKPEEK